MPTDSAVVVLCLEDARKLGESHWKPVPWVDVYAQFVVVHRAKTRCRTYGQVFFWVG